MRLYPRRERIYNIILKYRWGQFWVVRGNFWFSKLHVTLLSMQSSVYMSYSICSVLSWIVLIGSVILKSENSCIQDFISTPKKINNTLKNDERHDYANSFYVMAQWSKIQMMMFIKCARAHFVNSGSVYTEGSSYTGEGGWQIQDNRIKIIQRIRG